MVLPSVPMRHGQAGQPEHFNSKRLMGIAKVISRYLQIVTKYLEGASLNEEIQVENPPVISCTLINWTPVTAPAPAPRAMPLMDS